MTDPVCKLCGHVANSAPHRWGSDDYVKHDFEPGIDPVACLRELNAEIKNWQAGAYDGLLHVSERLEALIQELETAQQRELSAEKDLAQLCKDMREWFEDLDPEVRARANKQWFYGFLGVYER